MPATAMKRFCCVLAVLLPCVIPAAGERAPDKVVPPKPPLPAVRSLRLEPATLTLEDARDSRKVLVFGERTDGGEVDLTG